MDCGVNHGDGTSINKTSKSPDCLMDSVYVWFSRLKTSRFENLQENRENIDLAKITRFTVFPDSVQYSP